MPAAKLREQAERGIASALDERGAVLAVLEARAAPRRQAREDRRPYAESTSLTLEGEAGDTMFVMLSGHATVHKGGRKLAELGVGRRRR